MNEKSIFTHDLPWPDMEGNWFWDQTARLDQEWFYQLPVVVFEMVGMDVHLLAEEKKGRKKEGNKKHSFIKKYETFFQHSLSFIK